ncbi:MAG TPA: hypothetical protein VI365_02405 [Trebonia sp.]
MSTPARAGPAISITWKATRFSAMAAGSWPAGTRVGMMARRAGSLIALSALEAATRP